MRRILFILFVAALVLIVFGSREESQSQFGSGMSHQTLDAPVPFYDSYGTAIDNSDSKYIVAYPIWVGTDTIGYAYRPAPMTTADGFPWWRFRNIAWTVWDVYVDSLGARQLVADNWSPGARVLGDSMIVDTLSFGPNSVPAHAIVPQVISDISAERGAIAYFTGIEWIDIGIGASGDVLKVTTDSVPEWTSLTVASENVSIDTLTGATFKTLEKHINNTNSGGRVSGGEISDAGSQTYDVAAGTGYIRSTDSHIGTLFSFDWSAASSQAIADGAIEYVFVDYNGGSPQLAYKTVFSNNSHDEFFLGSVIREGDSIYVASIPDNVINFSAHVNERWRHDGFVRKSGLIIGETGTRNITTTAGEVYYKVCEMDWDALDTSSGDTFSQYRQSTLISASETQYNNTQYDNGSGLSSLTTNRFGTRWVYLQTNNGESTPRLITIIGTSNATSVAAAQAEGRPANVPLRVSEQGLLVGRYVIQQGASSASVIETAFGDDLQAATAASHSDLANLGNDDHTQYLLRTQAADWGDSSRQGASKISADYDDGADMWWQEFKSGVLVDDIIQTEWARPPGSGVGKNAIPLQAWCDTAGVVDFGIIGKNYSGITHTDSTFGYVAITPYFSFDDAR